MEWVEVKGKTVEAAVQAAIQELGLSSVEEVSVEVLQEPAKGILGIGGQPAVVRVTRKVVAGEGGQGRSRRGGRGRVDRQGSAGRREQARDFRGRGRDRGQGRRDERPRDRGERRPAARRGGESSRESRERNHVETTPEEREAQRQEIETFLNGLLAEFGLEGEVSARVEEDTVLAEIKGEQTEALVGTKGGVMQAVHELLRAVVQRKSTGRARVRLDIGGYQERRREALRIYAERLAKRVVEEGGEAMLEPMNPADRKVVHDAILLIPGVRSYSEGEEPERAVVIAAAEPNAGKLEAVADGNETPESDD